MLSDQDSQLLTAYLDGQLSARQRKTALRLLHRSPEARKLLQKLQEDAHGLQRLPPRKLPPDFPLKVLRTIADRGLQPGGARPLPLPRGLPTWVGIAAAAAVLLLVAGGSFVYFGDRLDGPQRVTFRTERVLPPPPLDPLVAGMVARTVDQFASPVKPGVYIPLLDLGQQTAKTRLAQELQQHPAHHLVLESANNPRAVERLTSAFEHSGIQVLVAPAARATLKKKQPQTTYVVYAENVRPDELAKILEQFGRPVAPPGERVCENVLLNPMSELDRKHLSKLLGVSPSQLDAVPLSEPPIFVPKGDAAPKVRPRQPAPKKQERFAVVLASNSAAGRPLPAEIERFLANREQPRPGTVRVFLVLHEASA